MNKFTSRIKRTKKCVCGEVSEPGFRLMNKKGLSQLADIAMSIILFTIFFAIIMIIGGSRLMFVHATVDAANTALLCRNDLNAVMEFPSSEADMKIKEVLVDEYSEKISRKEYPRFEKEIRSVFDKHAPGQGKWKIKLLKGTSEVSSLITEDWCIQAGDYWYNNSCHEISFEEKECKEKGWYWYDDTCHEEISLEDIKKYAKKLTNLSEFGEIEDKKNLQTCNYFVPLPCDEAIEKCAMEVQLELVSE